MGHKPCSFCKGEPPGNLHHTTSQKICSESWKKEERCSSIPGLGKGQGGAEWKGLDPQHRLPCSFPWVCVAHFLPHRRKNVLNVATEIFIFCLIVIQIIHCGQMCDTVFSGEYVFYMSTG